jgi:GT2 family glycosyltransferase
MFFERANLSTGLSLVLATLDEGAELRETVRSIIGGSVRPGEIVVVDDGGIDGSCDALKHDKWRVQGVKLHRVERSGIAAARNIGSKLATGSHLVFLDAHCRLDFDCLRILQEALDRRPDAIVAPAICDFGGTVYGCGARLIDAELRIRWLPPNSESEVPYLLPIAPGGCLAMGKATFQHLGGFGAFRELGLEDIELSLRAWRAGIDVLAVPDAKLQHRFRPTPPYALKSTSRAYNVARVALVHFDGSRREQCLRKIIGTPQSAEILVDSFASDWEEQRNAISSISTRMIEAFFEQFGDWN